jgi:outer membrane biosynthesis protein TonB
MNDQLDDPAKSPTEGDGSQEEPAPPSGQIPAQNASGSAPNPKVGEIRRPVKRRKAAPRRRVAGSSRPAQRTQPHVHHYDKLVDEGDDEGFFGKHRTKFVIAAVALIGGSIAYFLHSAKPSSAAPKAPERITMISLPPPPPPPPPPKHEPPPPKEEKMVQETAAEVKPKEEAPKPAEPPKEALGTGVKGNGPGISGLGGSGDGGGFGGGRSGNGGSKWGAFASQVQNKVASALRTNSRTNKASLKIQVRIWPDATGRIMRAKLDASTGDPKLDAIIQNEVLTGLQLDTPPPAGMPMPIVMRLSARRP